MKKIYVMLLSIVLLINTSGEFKVHATGDASKEIDIQSTSAILMEPTSGKVIYEKNPHEKLRPASVTKIMTLLLVFDALEQGNIKLEDKVVVSEHAASMGGSQVFLEPNEVQTVNDMIKCISIASANDASVAMAEHVAGSEEAFVNKMNERAKQLGMKNTNFVNCSGLDSDNHLTTAYDIALMTKELVTKYPKIFEYSKVWMDKITHNTKRGEEDFGLTNTNKLLKWYNGATGLKTGSTSLAKYCLSGTAKRNGMDLIAVVMAAPDYKLRFKEVMKLFDYGFANCSIYQDKIKGKIVKTLPVKKGKKETLDCIVQEDFSYVITKNGENTKIKKEFIIGDDIKAPINKGEKVGEIIYKADNQELGRLSIVAKESIGEISFAYVLDKILKMFFK